MKTENVSSIVNASVENSENQTPSPMTNQQRNMLILWGVFVLFLIIIGGDSLLKHTKKSTNPQPAVSKVVSPTSTTKIYNSSETNNFPVYPGATFLNKEDHQPCLTEVAGGFAGCGSTTYVWMTKDDFDQVSSWFRDDKSNTGWNCSGGAGSYDSPRSANGRTTCRKGELTYSLDLLTTAEKTEITLIIPLSTYGWREFVSKQAGISFKYPVDWKLIADSSDTPHGADNSTIISPNGTKIKWLSDSYGLGGGPWIGKEVTIKITAVEPLASTPDLYYVEYTVRDGTGIAVVDQGPHGGTPQVGEDTEMLSYYTFFKFPNNPKAAGILSTFSESVKPADKDNAKLILKSLTSNY